MGPAHAQRGERLIEGRHIVAGRDMQRAETQVCAARQPCVVQIARHIQHPLPRLLRQAMFMARLVDLGKAAQGGGDAFSVAGAPRARSTASSIRHPADATPQTLMG